jgi:putative copper export protein
LPLALDAFRVAIRWLHLLAAVAWVGGSLFYLFVLQGAAAEVGRRFRDLVQLSIITLLVTGAVLTFDRLQLEPGPNYVVTLGLKIALAIWMFLLAQDLASRGRRRLIERRLGGIDATPPAVRTPSWLILALGLVVLLLSDVLRVIGPA